MIVIRQSILLVSLKCIKIKITFIWRQATDGICSQENNTKQNVLESKHDAYTKLNYSVLSEIK